MIRFIKNSCQVAIAFVLVACNQKKEQVKLPFFNKPDFTPEWIDGNNPDFKNIHQIPPFSFLNQNGDIVTEKSVEGKIYVANFMFTSCISICPLMTENMKMLQDRFSKDTEVLFLSHSVMPDIDSVESLKKYSEKKGIISGKWYLLTGNRDSIYAIAKQHYFAGDSIGFYGNQKDFLHTENFILVDQNRRIRGVYNGTLKFEMERIMEDIETLKREN